MMSFDQGGPRGAEEPEFRFPENQTEESDDFDLADAEPPEFESTAETESESREVSVADQIARYSSFTAMRSSGSGGQNVNKVSSAVEIRFDLGGSEFSEAQKERIRHYAGKRRNKETDEIVIKVQDERDQPQNKRLAKERLRALIEQALLERKARKATKPSQRQKERRLASKHHDSRKKEQRQWGRGGRDRD